MVELRLSSQLDPLLADLDGPPLRMQDMIMGPEYVASTRPAYVSYHSAMIRLARKLVFFAPYFVGWWTETERLVVPVMLGMHDNTSFPYVYASVRLTNIQLQVYSASLLVRAEMHGLTFAALTTHAVLTLIDTSCTTGSCPAMCWASTCLLHSSSAAGYFF